MCGLNGIIALADHARRDLSPSIEAMNRAIAHRGPDGEGRFVEGPVALGHRRLSIIDLSDAGSQPMFSADGDLVLVFNGEIYNYLELAEELTKQHGCVMRSNSDSEVILHAFAVWGERCVQRFNGMWAFALWCRSRQRLFASRDRLGVKPFLFTERDGRLLFSSEPAGLRAAVPLNEVDEGKLFEFLAYGYRRNDGQTFFKGVQELPPGHNLLVEGNRWRLSCFWTLAECQVAPTAMGRREQLRELLSDAVRLRMRSDVPVALLQSGGLDSSVICSIVNQDVDRGRLAMHEVLAFTAVNPGSVWDESAAVRAMMVRAPHVRLVELQVGGDELASDLSDYVVAMQEPQASAASYAHWRLMQMIRGKGFKVVLNGQGADEAFAGYGVLISGYRLLDALFTSPKEGWAEAKAMRSRMPGNWSGLLGQTAKAVLGRRTASRVRGQFSEGGWGVMSREVRRRHLQALPEVGMVWGARNLQQHLRSQLLDYGFNQILNYEDYSSMSQGIEIRSPFIDYRLMEFAFSLPDEDKFHRGVTKKIVRDTFRASLPAAIVDEKSKIGFRMPFEDWVRHADMRALIDEVLSSRRFRECALWDADALARHMRDPGSAGRGFPVWRFLVAHLWMDRLGLSVG